MDLLKAILKRRSVRFYTKQPVSDELIKEILEKATWAPSACNRQGWRFIIIKEGSQKEKLIKSGTAFFVKDAPILILVLYDNRTDREEYKDYIQSASAAIQNIHLLAYSKGLGSCWVNNLPPQKEVRKIFRIPNFYTPIALITLGYPDKERYPKQCPRLFQGNKLFCHEYFNFKEKESLKDKVNLRTRKFSKRLYLNLPTQLKSTLDPFARKFEKRFDK